MYGRGSCSSTASFRFAAIQTKRFAERRNLLARHCRTWRRNHECWRQLAIHTGSPRLVQFSVFNARSFPQFGELSVTHSSERIAFSPALFKPRLAIQPDASSSEKLSNISSDGLPFKYGPYWPNRGMSSFRTISFGSARLTRAVSRISANWHKADITQTSGGLQRQPNVRFSG